MNKFEDFALDIKIMKSQLCDFEEELRENNNISDEDFLYFIDYKDAAYNALSELKDFLQERSYRYVENDND